MKITKAEFIKSQSKFAPSDIEGELPQIAVVGKSNVGKSSFINYLCNNGKLARTGKQPGRTRLINYFLCNDIFYLVDLPGYGYAEVSKVEKQKWANMIETYLVGEHRLRHIFLLIDSRHDVGENDCIMYNYIAQANIPFTIVATKTDKLSAAQTNKNIRAIAAVFKVGSGNILPLSSVKKTGIQAVCDRLDIILANNGQEDT